MSPDRRRHRGAHPEDRALFAAGELARLCASVADLSWLLGRDYATKAALKLVGDRHGLDERQRLAVSRAACSDRQRDERASKLVAPDSLRGERLIVDGFNLTITVEAALGGGVLLLCRDGALRDLSSVHGSYRSVEETEAALALTARALDALAPARVRWLLDRPVSNSGRLAQKIETLAREGGRPWEVETVFNPDREIAGADGWVAVTSDSNVIDAAARWANLARRLVETHVPGAWLIDLDDPS